MSDDPTDIDLELAGIDDGGNNKPNAYWDESRYAWVYRASAVNACELQLGLFRQGYEGAPPPPDMLRRFRDGHIHERPILAAIQAERPGWRVHPEDPHTGSQYETEYWVKQPDRDASITGICIVGHIDGLAINPAVNPDSRIAEAKALSKANFEKFVKAYERGRVWDEYPYYRDSITVYMESLEVGCIYGVKNKDSGEVFVFDLDKPPGDMAAIATRIRVIDARAGRDELPETCDRRSYPCPMFRFHDDSDSDDPEAIMAAAVDTTSEEDAGWVEELEVLCREYDALRAAEKENGAKKKEMGLRIAERFLVMEDKVQTPGFTVSMKQHTYRFLDEQAMRDDGVDVEAYRRERVTEYPNVQRRRKKK